MIRCALHGPGAGLSRAFIKVSEEGMFERVHFTGQVGVVDATTPGPG